MAPRQVVVRQRGGRPDKLTDQVSERMLAAVQQAGVTQEDACRLAGLSVKTLEKWRKRVRDLEALVPEQVDALTVAEIREVARGLGLEEDDIRGSGAVRDGRRRVVRADWLAAVWEVYGKFVDFLERLSRAHLEGELATVSALREIAHGGKFDARGVWVPRVRKKTVTVTEVARKAGEADKVLERREEETIVGPSERSLQFILERRYTGRWGPRKAVDPGAGSDDPQSLAARVAAALREMEQSVPGEAPEE